MVREGRLKVIDAAGRVSEFGPGGGTEITICFADRRMPWRLAFSPSIGLGEGYMDGRLTVEDGLSIYDLLAFFAVNLGLTGNHPLHRIQSGLAVAFRRAQQFNPLGVARRNVAHHYDLSGGLYELFLDIDKQYSCAYFGRDDGDLESAQLDKKAHLAAKLLPEPGDKILDIGCGWGGLGLYLAQLSGTKVTGITLSEEQHKIANERARALGLQESVQFDLRDYRHQTGRFERIVSVGMFEHVGVGHYGRYFSRIRDLLTDNGVALLHTIGRSGLPSSTDPWIRKYIFPGGYIPALSEVMPHIEKVGLEVTDIEFLGPHYAETLRHWRERFCDNWDKVANIYDERFCRMWEYYLAGSEVSFRHMGMTVFQIQMVKHRDALPLTRDYIQAWKDENTAEPEYDRRQHSGNVQSIRFGR